MKLLNVLCKSLIKSLNNYGIFLLENTRSNNVKILLTTHRCIIKLIHVKPRTIQNPTQFNGKVEVKR